MEVRKEERRLSCQRDQPNWLDIDLVIVKRQHSIKPLDDAFTILLSHELHRGIDETFSGKRRGEYHGMIEVNLYSLPRCRSLLTAQHKHEGMWLILLTMAANGFRPCGILHGCPTA